MIWRSIAAITVAAGAMMAFASPAHAHGGQGAERPAADNYRTTITSISPPRPGIDVRVLEAGSRIELRNLTDEDIVVLGYQGEPYLRVGPRGVYENLRSPATYLNADRQGRTEIPSTADPDAAPEWRKVLGAQVARWHDHRAHWMGDEDPPAVAADRSRTRIVIDGWVIPLQVSGERIEVTGDLTWVPPPSPWPWLAGSGVLGAITFGAVRRRPGPSLLVSSAALLLASILEAGGVWVQSIDSPLTKAGQLAVPAIAWTLLLLGLATHRRAPREGTILIGGAAAGLAWLFGLADLSWLSASQLPTAVAPDLARACIVISLGVGGSLLAAAVVEAKATRPTFARSTPGPPPSPTSVPGLDGASMRHHRRILLGGLLLIAVVAVFATAPARDDTGENLPVTVYQDLCELLVTAETDVAAAAAHFNRALHSPLHALAEATADRDRSAVARLLDAEQRVEETLTSDPSGLTAELARLEPTVRNALDQLGAPTNLCDTGSP